MKTELLPGGFHTTIRGLRCLGRLISGSGLDTAFVVEDIFGSVTLDQIIRATHYERSIEADQVLLQSLFDIWANEFSKTNSQMKDEIEQCAYLVEDALRESKDIGMFSVRIGELADKLEDIKFNSAVEQYDNEFLKFPMYKWARQYMNSVLDLLQH